MKKFLTPSAMILATFCMLFLGCTKEESSSDKGAVERLSDRTTDAIVEKLQVPVKKAEKATEILEQRTRDMDEELNE